MKCLKCGTELKDTAKFCSKCGVPVIVNNNASESSDNSTNKKKTLSKNILRMVLIFLVIVFLFATFGGRSYKSTVRQYIEAAMDADAKKMVSLMPKDLITYAIKNDIISSKKELIEDTKRAALASKNMRDESYGKGWKYDYTITSTHKYNNDELDMYLYYNSDIRSAKKGMDVSVTVVIDDTENIDMMLTLLKIGRKWYIAEIN